MINLVSCLNLPEYNAAPCINIVAEREELGGIPDAVHFEPLMPSGAAWGFWKNSIRRNEDWEVFKALYELQLETERCRQALKTLADLDEIYHRVNIVTGETDMQRSHLGLLVRPLDDLEVHVILRQ